MLSISAMSSERNLLSRADSSISLRSDGEAAQKSPATNSSFVLLSPTLQVVSPPSRVHSTPKSSSTLSSGSHPVFLPPAMSSGTVPSANDSVPEITIDPAIAKALAMESPDPIRTPQAGLDLDEDVENYMRRRLSMMSTTDADSSFVLLTSPLSPDVKPSAMPHPLQASTSQSNDNLAQSPHQPKANGPSPYKAYEEAELRTRILRMYRKYAPDKVDSLPRLFEKYEGALAELLDVAISKYGDEPADEQVIVVGDTIAEWIPALRGAKFNTVSDASASVVCAPPAIAPEVATSCLDREEVRKQIEEIYALHAPEKVSNVESIMARYEGNEAMLLDFLKSKYGPSMADL